MSNTTPVQRFTAAFTVVLFFVVQIASLYALYIKELTITNYLTAWVPITLGAIWYWFKGNQNAS